MRERIPTSTTSAPKSPERARARELPPEVIARTKERLLQIAADPKKYIDEGGAGWVYRLPAGVCMKVMRPHNESQTKGLSVGNSLEAEAKFLDHLSTVEVASARTPQYLSTVKNGELSALLMEEIEGTNLQKILNGTGKLPASFSHHVFFDALEKYIQALHENEHILHGDLEPRNIMIDTNTGMPRIIDFGRSRWTTDLPEERKRRLENLEWEKLNKIEEQMAALQR